MKTEKLRVSLEFGRGGDHRVEETVGAVLANLYDEPFFDAPPVNKTDLEAARDAFQAAIAAQSQGGTAATAAKRNRRAELVALMEALAFYVQVKSANDMSMLLASGFSAVRPVHTQTELAPPSEIRIRSGTAGETLITVKRVINARCYEVIIALLDETGTPGEWKPAGIHTRSRNMRITNLIPGRVYHYQLRAIGGITGYSGWSNPVSHRAA